MSLTMEGMTRVMKEGVVYVIRQYSLEEDLKSAGQIGYAGGKN